jgi:hypothetical protein
MVNKINPHHVLYSIGFVGSAVTNDKNTYFFVDTTGNIEFNQKRRFVFLCMNH